MGRGLAARLAMAAADDPDLADAGRHDLVPELHTETGSGDDVVPEGAPAPGAAVDGGLQRREPLAVKPTSRDGIETLSQHADRIDGILGGNDHPIATAEVALVHGAGPTGLLDDGVQGADSDRGLVASDSGRPWHGCLPSCP